MLDDYETPRNSMDELDEKVTALGFDLENVYAKIRQIEFGVAVAAVASCGCFAKLMGWI